MKRIAITVGHGTGTGGKYDPGACGNGFEEFRLARECAKYAQEQLNSVYDCQTDLFNYAGDLSLTERVKKFKDNTYSLLAEIHLNAGGGTGAEVYYSKYSQGGLGQTAAERVSAAIAADMGLKNRGARQKLGAGGKDYFAIIRETRPHAILVETLFIDSKGDVEKVSNAAGQKKMGQAIARGIATAMGLREKAAAKPGAPTVPAAAPAKKSVEELAKEVIRGKWGNGAARRQKLAAAGYDYAAVQKKVNELLKQAGNARR